MPPHCDVKLSVMLMSMLFNLDVLDALQCPFGPHNTALAPSVSSSLAPSYTAAPSSTATASAGSKMEITFESVLLMFLGTMLSVFAW